MRRLISKPWVQRVRGIMPAARRSPFRSALPGFDEFYYHYWYRDTVKFGGSAALHYLVHGWREGRDPSAGFSTNGYLAANPDVVAAGFNPLLHFLEHGLSEGRKGWQKDPSMPPPPPPPPSFETPMKLLSPPRGE